MSSEQEQLEEEIRILVTKVVDLGLYIEEHFKNAISLLFSREWASGYFPVTPDVSPVTLNGRAMQILQQWGPSGEHLRTVMVLQKSCNDFESLIVIINRIAERARSLDQDVEFYLAVLPAGGREAFYEVIRAAHVQLRGCAVALSTRQASVASRVIEHDGKLDLACLQAQRALQGMIRYDPSLSMKVQLLTLVVADIEQLGNGITRICQGIETISSGQILPYQSPDMGLLAAT